MPLAHATLGASSAHRWLMCPPSALLEKQFPNTDTVYTQEGTEAHSWCEKLLKGQGALKPAAKKKFEALPAEMQECCLAYWDYVDSLTQEVRKDCPDAEQLTEVRVDYSEWVPKGFGTCDCAIVSDGVLHIIDFKYGAGVPVSAEDNPQMKLYAAGAMTALGDFYSFEKIVLHIFQPRIDNISLWETSRSELLAWLNGYVRPVAQLAWTGQGQMIAGDHCRFCKAKTICRERSEFMDLVAKDRSKTLTVEEVAKKLGYLDDIQKWAKGLQDWALQKALEGEHFEGWKLVEGRSTRKITDPAAMAERLKENGWAEEKIWKPKELQTLTALEKTAGKKAFAELAEGLIEKPAGKPALVFVTDKRPEWKAAETDFADMAKGGN